MSNNVLITGGAGFLGVNLTRALIKSGYNVSLFDFLPLGDAEFAKKVKFVSGDIRKIEDVRKAVCNQQYVVHTAAILFNHFPKDQIFGVNVKGTENILEACLSEHLKRFVYISSTEVYGQSRRPDMEESLLNPNGYYAESKVQAEILCRQYISRGLSINVLRPRTFIGPGRLGAFANIFESIRTGKSVYLLGNGDNVFQFLAISDLVNAIQKALETKTEGQVFNLGSKAFDTWRSHVESVIQYAKSNSKIVGLPVLPILSLCKYVPGLRVKAVHYEHIAKDSYVSIAKAEQVLKWHPKKSDKELLFECYALYIKSKCKI